jgi:hypothetical protein
MRRCPADVPIYTPAVRSSLFMPAKFGGKIAATKGRWTDVSHRHS